MAEFWKFKIWIHLKVLKAVKAQHQNIMLCGLLDF